MLRENLKIFKILLLSYSNKNLNKKLLNEKLITGTEIIKIWKPEFLKPEKQQVPGFSEF